MRRAIGIALVLLALAGVLLASIAEAGMLPGSASMSSATTMMADGDCPHHQAGGAPHQLAAPAAGKALAFMPCCFGVGGAMLTVAAADMSEPLPGGWLRPMSDPAPRAGIPSPEPPPPRA